MSFLLKSLHFPSSLSALENNTQGLLLINTINAHSYNMARKDAAFAEALLGGDVLIPDGASIVKAVKWLTPNPPKGEVRNEMKRIAGWDLFVWEMNQIEQRQGKVFFLGSTEGVLEKIKARAAVDYPGLEIYTYSPPYKQEFTEEDNKAMIDAVNAVQPDVLWIGMTAPKQEKWAYRHLQELDVKGVIGTIGAVFDFYAGTVERAPLWWQEHGLEWLFRLIKEPRRMWRRYIIGNMKFILYIIGEKFYSLRS